MVGRASGAGEGPPARFCALCVPGQVRYDGRMFGADILVVLVVVLIVVLIWRGPKMLPKWGETLGRGVKATRKEVTDLQAEMRDPDDPSPPPA